jgi:hypothetical protein
MSIPAMFMFDGIGVARSSVIDVGDWQPEDV